MKSFATIKECKEFLINTPENREIERALSRMDELGATFTDYQEIYNNVNWFPKLDEKLKQIALDKWKKKASESDPHLDHSF